VATSQTPEREALNPRAGRSVQRGRAETDEGSLASDPAFFEGAGELLVKGRNPINAPFGLEDVRTRHRT
jgi:hypothetical protein